MYKMEIFKQCHEKYEISNFGNCRRKLLNGEYRMVKGSINNRGYLYFQINRDNKRLNFLFHTMVAKCFIGERPENMVIDHIDRNKCNNNVTNLRYITQQENSLNCAKCDPYIHITDKIEKRSYRNKCLDDAKIESKTYFCSLCDKAFRSDWQLKRHLNGSYHNKRLHYDQYSQFTDKKERNKYRNQCREKKLKENKTYYCEICDNAFTRNSYLISHLKKHHSHVQRI